jgi:hypothetical protein
MSTTQTPCYKAITDSRSFQELDGSAAAIVDTQSIKVAKPGSFSTMLDAAQPRAHEDNEFGDPPSYTHEEIAHEMDKFFPGVAESAEMNE